MLFTITKANAAQYKDKLTPGTLAMLNKYDNFKMNVYPTRRTACLPQEAYDDIKAMATQDRPEGLRHSRAASRTRRSRSRRTASRRSGTTCRVTWAVASCASSTPSRCAASGDYYKIGTEERRVFFRNLDQPKDNLLGVFMSRFLAPATLEGTVFLVHEPIDQVKETRSAWIYNSGQRRVRRAPDLAYDNVNDGTEGLRTTDQFDISTARPTATTGSSSARRRSTFRTTPTSCRDKKLKYKEDIIRKNTPNADLMRYELHRVWEVEATLKPGSKPSTASARSTSTRTAGRCCTRTPTTPASNCGA